MKRIYTPSLISARRPIILVAMGGLVVWNIVFFIIPLAWGIVGSFHDWNPLVGSLKFIGFTNYIKAFQSPVFRISLINSFVFTSVAVVCRTILGLLIAMGLLSLTKGRDILRGFYFLPVIIPLVAVALMWKWIYNPRVGLLNFILLIFGVSGHNWLAEPNLAMPSILVMVIWKDLGYAIIIFIAGILNIPKMFYEAANIDGASRVQKFWYITMPLVKPTTIFIVITSLISYFQAFVQIFIMTKGGPGTSTHVLSYLIFSEAFNNYRFGYASALSFILFVIIMIITFVQFKILQVNIDG